MRILSATPALALCALLPACGGGQQTATTPGNSNTPNNNAKTASSIQHGTIPSNPGVTSSHGGGPGASSGGVGGTTAKPPVATPELDARIQKAEAKAKAPGASEADKKAAAAAFFARADFFRDQGSPALYKFALTDYRRGLRFNPTASEARAKMDEIVEIYRSMGRPVPELGNDANEQ